MDTAAAAWDFANAEPVRRPGAIAQSLYYEDLPPGRELESAPHTIDRNELVEFAKTWDPVPFHVDEEAGQRAFGGLTAPGLYMLAVKQRLIHTLPKHEIIASLGYDEIRFHLPLRPGDVVHLKETCVEQRESRSDPTRGIATLRFALINSLGAVVMSHRDTILIRRRDPAQA